MNHPASDFPIEGKLITSIPWAMIALHESRCLKNHGYTLTAIAELGGLTAAEANDVLDDQRWNGKPGAGGAVHEAELIRRVDEWQVGSS